MSYIPSELIQKKRLGLALDREEIRWIIRNFTSGKLPDYQMAAWAMAVWFRGMSDTEIAYLTEAMRDSGSRFDFQKLNAPRIDKHSTGGVGDKTSLIIGPILAAAEVYVPMIAGRGLGHTGGTLDKLESIPGFRIRLTRAEFEPLIEKHHFALMGQTEDICPADRKLYALRDVTSTIDSLPLICSSIMSKKLAEDLTGLVLDVKFGTGAFMKTIDDATNLANLLKRTGEKNGVRVHALLTNMNSPLGRFAGNAVEVRECVDILRGEKLLDAGFDYYASTRELSLQLSAHMLLLAERAKDPADGLRLATDLLESGRALRAFEKLLQYQGPADIAKLPKARHSFTVTSDQRGFLAKMNTERLGWASVKLGAGRMTAADPLDYSAGLEFMCRPGQKVEAGQPLIRIFANNDSPIAEVATMVREAIVISENPPSDLLPLVARVLT